MFLSPEDILKLLLAFAVGGVIGAEREMRDKAAGLRTMMFISTGSALFTIFSFRMASSGGATADPTRIAAQIVSGIGFLGAGVILREHGEVRGLTTAATVWLAAALGMGVGAGHYLFTMLASAVILVALSLFPALERWMGTLRQVRSYRLRFPASLERYQTLLVMFESHNLSVHQPRLMRDGEDMTCSWTAAGRPKNHDQVIKLLIEDPTITCVEV